MRELRPRSDLRALLLTTEKTGQDSNKFQGQRSARKTKKSTTTLACAIVDKGSQGSKTRGRKHIAVRHGRNRVEKSPVRRGMKAETTTVNASKR
jgi:hypothetical protein